MLTATRTLTNPEAVNVAGLGFIITTANDLGATTVTRTHTAQTGNGNASITRVYDVSPAQNNTGADATVVFAYDDEELGSLTEANLALYASDDGGTSWDDLSGTLDASGNTLTASGVDCLARFTAGTDLAALLQLALAAWLEGPYDASADAMTVALSSDLPLSDPYSLGQSVNAADFFTTDTNGQQVVDWVYLQLRSDETTVAAETAALLMSDGSITTTDATSAASLDVVPGSYWLVVGHRNHLAVMSSAPLDCSSGSCSYDFRSSQGLAYGDDAMAEMTLGAVGLYAGDADGSGDIFNTDLVSYWLVQTGTAGYLSADFDLSGDVFNTDLVSYWLSNTGRSTNVPAASSSAASAMQSPTAEKNGAVRPEGRMLIHQER
jgi:hypothetical protein